MKIGDNVVLRGTIKGVTYGKYGFPHYLVNLPNGCETEFPKPYIEDLQQLDKPEKVKVKQCVADWYEKNKDDFETSLFQCIYELFKKRNDSELNEFENWVIDENTKPFQTLVNMHQFGYEVEEEKRYLVKIKGNIKENVLVYGELLERYFFTKSLNLDNAIYSHTRKELEDADFGWVFDCPGIEIEEVE